MSPSDGRPTYRVLARFYDIGYEEPSRVVLHPTVLK